MGQTSNTVTCMYNILQHNPTIIVKFKSQLVHKIIITCNQQAFVHTNHFNTTGIVTLTRSSLSDVSADINGNEIFSIGTIEFWKLDSNVEEHHTSTGLPMT